MIDITGLLILCGLLVVTIIGLLVQRAVDKAQQPRFNPINKCKLYSKSKRK